MESRHVVDNIVYTTVRFVPRDEFTQKRIQREKSKMSTPYEAELRDFEGNGYIFIPNFLNDEETALLFAAAKADTKLMDNAFDVADAQGGKSRLTGWSHVSDDVYGMVAAAARVVDRMEGFLGGEVYHYNSKMMLKEPRVGGA
jgi:ectoine hydroxylase